MPGATASSLSGGDPLGGTSCFRIAGVTMGNDSYMFASVVATAGDSTGRRISAVGTVNSTMVVTRKEVGAFALLSSLSKTSTLGVGTWLIQDPSPNAINLPNKVVAARYEGSISVSLMPNIGIRRALSSRLRGSPQSMVV